MQRNRPTFKQFAAWTAVVFISYLVTIQMMLVFSGIVARLFTRFSSVGTLTDFDTLFFYLLTVIPIHVVLAVVFFASRTEKFRFMAGMMLFVHGASVARMYTLPVAYDTANIVYPLYHPLIIATELYLAFYVIRYFIRRKKERKYDYRAALSA